MYASSKVSMFSERDTLMKAHFHVLGDKKLLFVVYSTEHEDYPIDPKKIRMDYFEATMIEEVDNNIQMTEFSQWNLKGYFPMRLLNMVMATHIVDGKLKPRYKML